MRTRTTYHLRDLVIYRSGPFDVVFELGDASIDLTPSEVRELIALLTRLVGAGDTHTTKEAGV